MIERNCPKVAKPKKDKKNPIKGDRSANVPKQEKSKKEDKTVNVPKKP